MKRRSLPYRNTERLLTPRWNRITFSLPVPPESGTGGISILRRVLPNLPEDADNVCAEDNSMS